MNKFNLNDTVVQDNVKGIFTVVGIREFELELEDDTSCEWVSINNVSHYLEDDDSIEKWEFLYNKINNEGFHYCFSGYSNWDDIKDQKFHNLRLDYLKSASLLNKYVLDKIEKLRD